MNNDDAIIPISIGNVGNIIGNDFLNMIAKDHEVDSCGEYYGDRDLQLDKITTYFEPTTDGKFLPRAIFADLDEPSICHQMRSTERSFYKPVNGTGSNYALGSNLGREIVDDIMNTIRKDAEKSSLQGFQLIYDLGGGTGSSISSMLLSEVST
jgi:tubulin beta